VGQKLGIPHIIEMDDFNVGIALGQTHDVFADATETVNAY
jgi:hypothetical protein